MSGPEVDDELSAGPHRDGRAELPALLEPLGEGIAYGGECVVAVPVDLRLHGVTIPAPTRIPGGQLTSDRCAGTLTRVRQGVVEVFDATLRRTVRVPAPRTYLAKP